jgi:hypothetical protein
LRPFGQHRRTSLQQAEQLREIAGHAPTDRINACWRSAGASSAKSPTSSAAAPMGRGASHHSQCPSLHNGLPPRAPQRESTGPGIIWRKSAIFVGAIKNGDWPPPSPVRFPDKPPAVYCAAPYCTECLGGL